MRVTGGIYRSRQVKMPPGIIRPAMDRMRESMFAIHLSYYAGSLDGFRFLDLFSGSAIVAIEAASRGCSYIELVEKDAKKRATILENLKIVEPSAKHKLYILSVERYLQMAAAKKECFDLIHLDPPFPLVNKFNYLKDIEKCNLLSKQGTLTIHYPKEDEVIMQIGALTCMDIRSYGQSQLAFYRLTTSPA